MANEDLLLKEVDQELAEDKQWAWMRQYGPMLIGGGAALVLGVAGLQIWGAQQDKAAERHALEFRTALETLAEEPENGQDSLLALAEEGGGYGYLAQLHRAASLATSGERVAAREAYKTIFDDSAAPMSVRDAARLRSARLALVDGRDAVLADLGNLPERGGSFAAFADELAGLAALRARDYETALSIFGAMTLDLAAPASIRERAKEFAALAESAKAGVNIFGEARVDQLLDALQPTGGGVVIDAIEADDHGDQDLRSDEAGAANIEADAQPIEAGDGVEAGADENEASEQNEAE